MRYARNAVLAVTDSTIGRRKSRQFRARRTLQRVVLLTAAMAMLSTVFTTVAVSAAPGDAPITGSFFVDFGRDGELSPGDAIADTDPLFPSAGIVVTAYDRTGASIAGVVSPGEPPTYMVDPTTLSGSDYRLEFSLDPADEATGWSATVHGADSASSVQFVSAGDVANFGVVPPTQCNNGANGEGSIFFTCHTIDSLSETVVRSEYDTSNMVTNGSESDTGSVWGIAYDEWTDTIWTSSVQRRGFETGSAGMGGMYAQTAGGDWRSFDLGPAFAGGFDPLTATDEEQAAAVGRVGIGDIDLSEDGRTLFVTNVATNEVYIYDVTSGSPVLSTIAPVPNPGCGAGDSYLIWAANAISSETVLIGVTCTADVTQTGANLTGHVVEVSVAGGAAQATPVPGLSGFPLDYDRGCGLQRNGCTPNSQPWTDSSAYLLSQSGDRFGATWNDVMQPILSDIEVGLNGELVLGIIDRTSFQHSGGTMWDDSSTPGFDEGPESLEMGAGGDLLHVANTGTVESPIYVMEDGVTSDSGVEFFAFDESQFDAHREIFSGGAWIHPAFNEVMITAMDPLRVDSYGFERGDVETGASLGGFELGANRRAFKAGVLNDVEGCFAPVEIGDRVWLDANGDGIQDPGEIALEGVTVTVTGPGLPAGGVVVLTDENGLWTVDSIDGLMANEDYTVTVDPSSNVTPLPGGLGNGELIETTANATGGVANENNDSNLVGGTMTAKAGAPGTNDHSYDAGFTLPFDNRIGNLVWLDLDNDATVDVDEPGIAGLTVELYLESGDTPGLDAADTLVSATTTDATGNYWFEQLDDTSTYYVAIPEDQSANTVTVDGQTLDPATITSSTGGDTGNNDTDNNDDGEPATGFASVSGPIALSDGGEVTNEADTNTGTGAEAYVEGAGSADYEDANSNLTVDLGFTQSNRIGNTVWLDGREGEFGFNDGIAQPTESGLGLGNVELELYADAGVIGVFEPGVDVLVDTTTTDADGSYWFENVPDGNYFIGIPSVQTDQTVDGAAIDLQDLVSSTVPISDANAGIDDRDDGAPAPGFAALSGSFEVGNNNNPTDEAGDFEDGTEDGAEADINTKGSYFVDANSDLTIDFSFIEAPQYSIGNLVWVDTDGDGFAETGEPGIEGVTVELYDDNDNLVDTTTTDINGSYVFEGLAAGDYRVSIPTGQTGQTVAGEPRDLDDLLPTPINVPDPDASGDADNDNNGVPGAGEISSGLISIGDPDQLTPTEPTNETLRIDDPTDDDDGGSTTDEQRNFTVDFGFVEPLRVGNLVWLDDGGTAGGAYTPANEDDGTANPGEVGIEGVLVQLLDDTDTVIAETVTDSTGNYWFDGLVAGDYSVGVPADQVPLFGTTGIIPGALDGLASSTGQSAAGEDADNDDDGDASGVFASLSQPFNLDYGDEPDDENGDFGDGTADAAETDANASLGTVTADNSSNLEIDLGFAPTPTYRIGNLVWVETDDDGIAEDGEPGVPGLLVQLLDENGAVVAETITDGDGKYLFDELVAGDYQVRIPNDQTATLGGADGTPGLFDDYRTAGTPEPDADENVDNDNNGVEEADGLTSGVVTLGGDPEPSNETLRLNDGTADEDGTFINDRSNLTVDFGLTPVYRIGNLVWEDYDNDGLAEDGEPGIQGVLVQLLDENGAVIAETVTDADGKYEFTGLDAGEYSVTIPGDQTPDLADPQPDIVAGALDGLNTSGTPESDANNDTDNDNNGVVDGADFTSGPVTLGDGEPEAETLRDDLADLDEDGTLPDANSNLTVDFGFFRGLRVGNQIFLDGQQGEPGYNNGIFDPGEVGISGVDVELWEDSGPGGVADGIFDPNTDTLLDTVTTDSEGNYAFEGVDPETPYFVAVEDVGEGLATTAAVTGEPTDEDNDNDGAPDAASGYDSVTDVFTLDDPATTPATTGETDTNPAGDETADDEANATGDVYPDTNSEMTVDLGFIEVPLYRIGNLVWEDVDNDGIAEDGEDGIDGVTVELINEGGEVIATTETAGGGKYEFPLLVAGTYTVSIPKDQPVLEGKDSSNNGEDADPNGLTGADNNDNGVNETADAWSSDPIIIGTDTAPFGSEPTDEVLRDGSATDDDPDAGFYLDNQSNFTVDFGFLDVPQYSLGNQIWVDDNDDGIADAGEPGIGGVTVNLLDDNGDVIDTTTTDADGTYLFEELAAGEYAIEIPAGQTGQTIDDGTNRPVDLQDLLPSSVENPDPSDDTDNDNNGVDQGDGSVRTGLISIGEPDPLNPDEPVDEVNRNGGDDDDGGSTTDAQRNFTLDVGFTEPLRVGNLVWLDDGGESNGTYDPTMEDNGIADDGEPGIEGVLVQLLDDTDTVIAETVTDANGNYWFEGLRAGDYSVGIPEDQVSDLAEPTTGIIDGALDEVRSSTGISAAGEDADDDDDGDPDTAGGWASLSDPFNLDHNDEATDEAGDFGIGVGTEAEDAANAAGTNHVDSDSNLEIDFGFAPVPTYRLGNLVWEDYDNDGLAEDGEPGIQGVLVQLLDDAGAVIAETVTDADGTYEFTGLEAGDYQVTIPGDQTPDLADPQPDIVAGALDGLNTSGTPNGADDESDNDNNGVVDGPDFTSGSIELGEGTGNEEPTGETLRDDDPTLDEDGALRDDRSELTVDFGFFRGLRLGNQIFLDGEQGEAGYANGIFDDGELGIAGVDVELWEDTDDDGVFDPAQDTLIDTATTDDDGNYVFENLEPGTPYFVAVEEVPNGGFATPGLPNGGDPVAADNDNDGAAAGGYASVSSPVTLEIGTTSTSEQDENPNPDDPAEDEANAAGNFYPDGNSELHVDLGFVEIPLYRIGNLVWDDLDNDGIAEDGEDGINGVTVELLDSDGNVIATTVTGPSPAGEDGWYEFPALQAGDYFVAIPMDQVVLDGKASSDNGEELVANDDGDNNDNGLIDGDKWVSSVVMIGDPAVTDPTQFGTEPTDEVVRDGSATDDDPDASFYLDDRSNYSVDFGFLDIPTYEIGNLVWVDKDDDGVADSGEPGIGGVELELLDENGDVVQTTTTEADGSYLFTDLPAGDYQVVIPADQTGQTIDDGSATPVDLQDLLPSAVNVSDPDDPADVDNDSNGVPQPDGTISAGFVTVGDDDAGDLDELNPNEPTDETDRAGGTDIDPTNDVDDARQNATVDFGFAEPLRIGNLVWLDDGDAAGTYVPENQDNGIADDGEVGILGVLVQLLDDSETVIAETVTDANGNYAFESLRKGDYRVGIPVDQAPVLAEPQPDIIDGATDGLQSSNGQSASAEVADDDDDGDPTPDFISLSDFVNLDNNTEADDEGGDFADTTDNAAEEAANAAGTTHSDTNSNLEVDLGLTPIPTYRLGNLIWEDIDDDGLAEEGEPGIQGVLVQLLDENGEVVAETVTDIAGMYLFEDLEAGDYQVRLPADQAPTLGEQPLIEEGVLDGLRTSGTPEPNADGGTDNDNNGVEEPEGFTSGVVTLGDGDTKDEPEGETFRDDVPALDEDGAMRDDRSNLTVDFGLFRGLRLGNQVFLDGEQGDVGYNNGIFDPEETGIAAVEVELWEDDGDGVFDPATDTLVDTTVTDSEGNYSFGNLEPDTPYFVAIEDVGVGAASETVSAGPIDSDNDNDGAPTAGYDSVSQPVVLTVGGATTGEIDAVPDSDGPADTEADLIGDAYPDNNSEMSVDFGFIDLPLYRIGNLVWDDVDNDGIAEDGEDGIAGVSVQLLNAVGEVVAETTTDADGTYEFPNLLAGDYVVSIPMDQDALDGFQSSNQGEEADPNDDGDNNDNGIDNGDAWTSGTIAVGPNPLVAPFGSEPTDETLRADDATDDDDDGGFYRDDRSNFTVDFGFYKLALGSQVWLDTDGDGMLDPEEAGIDDVPVVLYKVEDDGSLTQVDETVTSTIAGEPGSYVFDGLESGATYVVELPAEAFEDGGPLDGLYSSPDPAGGAPDPESDPTDGDDNGTDAAPGEPVRSAPVTLVAGEEPTGEPNLATGTDDANENLTVDFGVTALSLGGTLWEDTDENGSLDPGEPVAPGVPVELWEVDPETGEIVGDAPVATTTTDPDGSYLFDGLTPGDFIVRVPADAFGPTGTLAGQTSTIGNGVTPPDPDDDPTDSDDNGELFPEGWVQTLPVTLDYGTEPLGEPDVAPSGDASDNHTVDLGFVPTPPMSLGNRVWLDTNKDGLQDDDEEGIADVVLELLDAATGEVVAETVTDDEGYYLFDDLMPGTYIVRIPEANLDGDGVLRGHANSEAFDPTDPDDDPTDRDDQGAPGATGIESAPITLVPTFEPVGEADLGPNGSGIAADMDSNLTVDFGFYKKSGAVRPAPEQISGAFWLDENNDGVLNPGEVPLPGVNLTIVDASNGDPVQELVTDANGYWFVERLFPGEYRIVIDSANFAPGGALDGLLAGVAFTDLELVIQAADEPQIDSFGNKVDRLFGLTVVQPPAPVLIQNPLALTGGDRQVNQLMISLMLLGLGSTMLALGRGRRRRYQR